MRPCVPRLGSARYRRKCSGGASPGVDDIASTELSTLHCTSGVDAKRLQVKKQRDANCATKNLFGGQTGKASDILVEHANRKEKLSWTCSCGLW
uniref:Uncharacterized protein n=1 Tax=Oryza rufipogon TaxID=4529 RepID=A0A0E0N7E5_ORYRU